MKIIDRLYQYFKYKNVAPGTLEKELDIPLTYFYSIRRRNSYMGEKMILMIISHFDDLNPSWLLFGEGAMIVDIESMTDEEKVLYYSSRLAALKQELKLYKEALESVESES